MKKMTMILTLAFVAVSSLAFAESLNPKVAAAIAYSCGLIMAVASAFGTFSQSRAAAAALEGIARNPQAAEKIGTPLILSLALMESLVLFAFLAFIFLQGKIV